MLRPKQRFSEVTRPKYNCTSVPHSRKLKYPLALEIATKTKSVRPGDFQHVHHMYVFQNESTLYSCLNVKELLAWNRRVHDIRTYSQMHRTDKYSQHSSIIYPVWLNDWVFVDELSTCGFERVPLQSLKLQISRLFWARSFSAFRQL